ncbi:MAG: DUF411 domain-containing protein [Vicinamibacteraceae bacterium]
MMMIRSAAAAVVSAVVLIAGVGVVVVNSQTGKAATGKPSVAVFKSPTCGCCAKWNEHMTAAGYVVASTDRTDMTAVKDEHRIPSSLRSCHTALVGGYVIEGHVPADVVAKLLAERPAGVVGIAVPGMPAGSPGMESADGFKAPYQVMAFTQDGQSRVYATK